MHQTELPADRGFETFSPLLERLLDRHHAEAMQRAESYHHTELAAILETQLQDCQIDRLLRMIAEATTRIPRVHTKETTKNDRH